MMVYRPPLNSSEDVSQFIFNFSVDREIILIGDFNLLIIFKVTLNLPPKHLFMFLFRLV